MTARKTNHNLSARTENALDKEKKTHQATRKKNAPSQQEKTFDSLKKQAKLQEQTHLDNKKNALDKKKNHMIKRKTYT